MPTVKNINIKRMADKLTNKHIIIVVIKAHMATSSLLSRSQVAHQDWVSVKVEMMTACQV